MQAVALPRASSTENSAHRYARRPSFHSDDAQVGLVLEISCTPPQAFGTGLLHPRRQAHRTSSSTPGRYAARLSTTPRGVVVERWEIGAEQTSPPVVRKAQRPHQHDLHRIHWGRHRPSIRTSSRISHAEQNN